MPSNCGAVNRSASEFVSVCDRIGMVFDVVHAVRPASETPPGDRVGNERVLHGAFAFDGDFVGAHALRHSFGQYDLRSDLQDGRVRGLACRTGELLQLEEIFDIRLFDGLQRCRFSGIADRGKAVFYVAAIVLCAEQRVDRQHAEFRNDGLPVAGRNRHGRCRSRIAVLMRFICRDVLYFV